MGGGGGGGGGERNKMRCSRLESQTRCVETMSNRPALERNALPLKE